MLPLSLTATATSTSLPLSSASLFLFFQFLHPIDLTARRYCRSHGIFWITAYLFFSLNPLGLAEQRAHWIAAGSRFPACNTALRRPLVSLQHLPLYTTHAPPFYHSALTTSFACCLRLRNTPVTHACIALELFLLLLFFSPPPGNHAGACG